MSEFDKAAQFALCRALTTWYLSSEAGETAELFVCKHDGTIKKIELKRMMIPKDLDHLDALRGGDNLDRDQVYEGTFEEKVDFILDSFRPAAEEVQAWLDRKDAFAELTISFTKSSLPFIAAQRTYNQKFRSFTDLPISKEIDWKSIEEKYSKGGGQHED